MDRYKVDLRYNYSIFVKNKYDKDYSSTHKTLKSAVDEFNTLKELLNDSKFMPSFQSLQLIDRTNCSSVKSYTFSDYSNYFKLKK